MTKLHYRFHKWVHAVDPETFKVKWARGYVNGEVVSKSYYGRVYTFPKVTVIGKWQ